MNAFHFAYREYLNNKDYAARGNNLLRKTSQLIDCVMLLPASPPEGNSSTAFLARPEPHPAGFFPGPNDIESSVPFKACEGSLAVISLLSNLYIIAMLSLEVMVMAAAPRCCGVNVIQPPLELQNTIITVLLLE